MKEIHAIVFFLNVPEAPKSNRPRQNCAFCTPLSLSSPYTKSLPRASRNFYKNSLQNSSNFRILNKNRSKTDFSAQTATCRIGAIAQQRLPTLGLILAHHLLSKRVLLQCKFVSLWHNFVKNIPLFNFMNKCLHSFTYCSIRYSCFAGTLERSRSWTLTSLFNYRYAMRPLSSLFFWREVLFHSPKKK